MVSFLQADTSHVIVEYNYGNQIIRSALKIYSDGRVEGKEIEHYRVKKSIEAQFSESDLARLKISIENASSGDYQEKYGSHTTLGSRSGSLIVHTMSKKSVPIRIIERAVSTQPYPKDTVTINLSPDARWIEERVLSFVETKMPLDQ
jgi:hypothetical protein